MEIVSKVKQQFLDNEQKILRGENVGLPWKEIFPKLGEFIPVIPPATQIMFVANSGIGKTHAWIGMVLYSRYKLQKLHPNKSYKFRFLIALLEDSKEMFVSRLFSMIFMEKYSIRVDPSSLNSMKGLLPYNVKSRLDDVEKEIEELLSCCEIIDSIYNPTGVFKWARAISNKLGVHHDKEMEFSSEDGSTYKHTVYSHYVPNDPNEQVILVVDNLNNLQQETEGDGNNKRLLTERETINKWSRKYGRLQITKHWGWTLINIMQLSADSEKTQYDQRGNLMVERCKPSLEGLGGSKECQRDHIIILALFSPNRYGITEYPERNGYNITRLKDSYRSVIIMKSNISETNKEIPMYFDGACSKFKELPSISEMDESKYKGIEAARI